MPSGVLITHILAVAGLASGSSYKGTQQQNIFMPCFPLFIQKSSSSPVNMSVQTSVFPLLSHMGLWEVLRCGTMEAYNPGWITSYLWSLKWPVRHSLPPLKTQAGSVREQGRKGESILERGRAVRWVGPSIKDAGEETDWRFKLKGQKEQGRVKTEKEGGGSDGWYSSMFMWLGQVGQLVQMENSSWSYAQDYWFTEEFPWGHSSPDANPLSSVSGRMTSQSTQLCDSEPYLTRLPSANNTHKPVATGSVLCIPQWVTEESFQNLI